jgi:hypothetical protein
MRATRRFFPLPDVGLGKLFPTHAKHFQILGLLLQIFPKIPLAVLCEINGLQGEKGNFALLQISCADPLAKAPGAAGKADMAESNTEKASMFFVFQKDKIGIEKRLYGEARISFFAAWTAPRR